MSRLDIKECPGYISWQLFLRRLQSSWSSCNMEMLTHPLMCVNLGTANNGIFFYKSINKIVTAELHHNYNCIIVNYYDRTGIKVI